MNAEVIADIIKRAPAFADDYRLTDSELTVLREALAEAPYFVNAALLLLRHGGAAIDAEEKAALQRRLALAASDRRTLSYADLGDAFADFYPPAESTSAPATDDVIDTFLRTYGNVTPEEEKQLERMIFNPTPDYAELLARQEQSELPDEADDEEPGSQDALINAFIRSQHPATHQPLEESEALAADDEKQPAAMPEPSDDSLLSESLAKIFIKKHRYERAYEIISGLSLKFPKKSAYFADQLRFLQKLIINQRQQLENERGALEK